MDSVNATDRYVMLVEDNEADVELTILALQRNNIANDMIVARDGQEALDYLMKGTRKAIPQGLPAVILLDLNMPKIDGLEVLRQLKSNDFTRRIPVVILTSSKEQQDMARGYELGANSYIQKPVDFNTFAEAVGQIGMYWLSLNEPPETIL